MNKRVILIFLATIAMFSLDSTILYFLPYDATKSSFEVIPYIGLLFFIFVVNDMEKNKCYAFSIVVGLYYAVVYGGSLPIYLILFPICTYYIRIYMKMSPFSWLEFAIVSISTVFVFELVIYLLMWITNTTELIILTFIVRRMLPTLAFVFVCSIVMFFFYNRQKRFEGNRNEYYS